MGQNNDPTERGDLQGNQGGNLARNPAEHTRLRQPEEGFLGKQREEMPVKSGKADNPGPRTPDR